MTVMERVQTYLPDILLELVDAFRRVVVELFSIFCGREGFDLVFQGIALRNQLEDAGEISALLRGYLGCGSIRRRSAISEGKDVRSTEHPQVVCSR